MIAAIIGAGIIGTVWLTLASLHHPDLARAIATATSALGVLTLLPLVITLFDNE